MTDEQSAAYDESKKRKAEEDTTEPVDNTETEESEPTTKKAKMDTEEKENDTEKPAVMDVDTTPTGAAGAAGHQAETTTDDSSNKEKGKGPPTAGKTAPVGLPGGGKVDPIPSKKPQVDPDKNPYESIRWTIVKNDGKPESLIKLVALKSLFAKQLPKMPRAYIARLVFDRRHISLVILNDDPKVKDTDKEVIGSLCYRPFHDMRFAEIAFCAVNSDHQVKVS